MSAGDWAFLTLGVGLGITLSLTVHLINEWATRRLDKAQTEALTNPRYAAIPVTWADDDLVTDLPILHADDDTRAAIRDGVVAATRAQAQLTVTQAEAYLADMPYDHEREGL